MYIVELLTIGKLNSESLLSVKVDKHLFIK